MTREIIMVTFDGKEMPLHEVAKLTGHSPYCLRKRWHRGERGAELIRPSHRGRFAKETSGQLDDLKAKREAREAIERAKQEVKLARQRREAEARERAMAEHAAAFARPLIDAKLVRPKERLAIMKRIKFSGQRNWRSDGGSFL